MSRGEAIGAPAARGGGFTIAIVDDQPVTRAGMEQVLSADPQLTLLASVGSVEELPPDLPIDAVVLALPTTGDTAAVVAAVAEFAPPLITSTWDRPAMLLDAIRAGARGCITRHSEPAAVRTAVEVVADGGFYLCRRLVGQFHTGLAHASPRDERLALAPREGETIRWIALGFTQSQIATRMGVSLATVNTYAKRIRTKLKVNNKAELTRMAIELGYLNNDRRHPAA